jgi:hypothetical protein
MRNGKRGKQQWIALLFWRPLRRIVTSGQLLDDLFETLSGEMSRLSYVLLVEVFSTALIRVPIPIATFATLFPYRAMPVSPTKSQ